MRSLLDLRDFIVAVFSRWTSGMSGGLGVLLTAMGIQSTLADQPMDAKQTALRMAALFWGGAVVFLFVAPYQAWLKERNRAVAGEAALNEHARVDDAEHDRRVRRDQWLALLSAMELSSLRELIVSRSMHTTPALSSIGQKTEFVRFEYPGTTHLNAAYQRVLEEWYRGEASKPRRLSPEQSACVVRALAGLRATIDVANVVSCPDAFNFAEDLAAAFRKAGWTVNRAPFMQARVAPLSGLAVEVPSPGMYTPDPQLSIDRLRASLQSAMDAAGLRAEVRERTEMWTQVHACIIVSHPPDSLVHHAGTSPPGRVSP